MWNLKDIFNFKKSNIKISDNKIIEKNIENKITPDYTKPSVNRRFAIGDVILYDEDGQQYNSCGNISPFIEPYTRTGIMLINGFDYDSDNAARCSVGRSAIGLKGVVYGNFCPSGKNYRKAKKHHIQKFINDIVKNNRNGIYNEELLYLVSLLEGNKQQEIKKPLHKCKCVHKSKRINDETVYCELSHKIVPCNKCCKACGCYEEGKVNNY